MRTSPLLVAAALAPAVAGAQAERPPKKLESTHLLAARANPLGLGLISRLSYQVRLFDSAHPALRDNFLGIGVGSTVSPAGARFGFLAEVQPMSILRVSLRYDLLGYAGAFGSLQSFPGVDADHSESALSAGEERGSAYATTGTQLTFGGLLQGKLGPIAVRNAFRLAFVDMDLRDGDRTYYDVTYDVLAPDEGWLVIDDLDLLWLSDFGLVAGVRWTVTDALYTPRHFATTEVVGAAAGRNAPTHRLGPLVAYTFDTEGEPAFRRPTVILLLNWWLRHRYRTGAEVSPAVPFVVLAFTFTGDLLDPR